MHRAPNIARLYVRSAPENLRPGRGPGGPAQGFTPVAKVKLTHLALSDKGSARRYPLALRLESLTVAGRGECADGHDVLSIRVVEQAGRSHDLGSQAVSS
jgi:hypothetical protein